MMKITLTKTPTMIYYPGIEDLLSLNWLGKIP